MPRSEARLQFGVWEGLALLSDQGKLLYLVSMTDEFGTQCGSGRISKDLWAEKLGWSLEKLATTMSELDAGRFVLFDEKSHEFLVRSFIRSDKVDRQPRVLQSALKSALLLKSARLRAALATELRRLDGAAAEGLLADVIAEALVVADRLDGLAPAKPVPAPVVAPPVPEPAEPIESGRPSGRCPKHAAQTRDPGPCRACASARNLLQEWETAQAGMKAATKSSEAKARAAERRTAIDACERCDTDGYDGRAVCAHKPALKIVRKRAQ